MSSWPCKGAKRHFIQSKKYAPKKCEPPKPCPSGATGSIGARGPRGAIGKTGPRGKTGPTGPTGPRGSAGSRGQQGQRGPTGASGTRGLFGRQGATGQTGPKGPTGPAGPTGEQGPTGPKGMPSVLPLPQPGAILCPRLVGWDSNLYYAGPVSANFSDDRLLFCGSGNAISSSRLDNLGGTVCGAKFLQIVSGNIGWTEKYILYIFDDSTTIVFLPTPGVIFDPTGYGKLECQSGGSNWNVTDSYFQAGRTSLYKVTVMLSFHLSSSSGTGDQESVIFSISESDGTMPLTWNSKCGQITSVWQDDVLNPTLGLISLHDPPFVNLQLDYVALVQAGNLLRVQYTSGYAGPYTMAQRSISIIEL